MKIADRISLISFREFITKYFSLIDETLEATSLVATLENGVDIKKKPKPIDK